MTTFDYPKPKLVLSKCLELEACRYDGQKIPDSFVKKLIPYVDLIPVCPEVAIGMGTPRETVALYGQSEEPDMIQKNTGIDFTEKMNDFALAFTQDLKEIDGFILKSRSPSCGMKDVKIYPNLEKNGSPSRGSGLFGKAVLDQFSGYAVEDEGRLHNFSIREHFLTKLYTLALFRELRAAMQIKSLLQFHADHKYLLMAYNQTAMREMGRLLANQKSYEPDVLWSAYGKLLQHALSKAARYTSNINVLDHCSGYFKKGLNKAEKEHFQHLIDQYRNGKVPLSVLLALLRSWIYRFDEKYLMTQRFFEPYPAELVEITDSGKGRSGKR